MARNAHLVGSVGLTDSKEVFTTVSDILGSCCPRIPDGETGERGYWIRWQEKTFANAPQIEAVEQEVKIPGFKDALKRTFYGIKPGTDPASITFENLGYADEAIASWKVFKAIADDGKIGPNTRFLVALPTPVALLSGFVLMKDRATLEPALNAAMKDEVEKISSAIPHDRLSIQWDVCYEAVAVEGGGPPVHYDHPLAGSISRVARLCDLVDGDIELGIHLCYGDPGHQHIVQPQDFSVCVDFANGICAAASRTVNYIHMPVPRDRDDVAYFEPLAKLNITAETKLTIGLVHHTDGIEGSRRRMAQADKYVRDYDIATECGFGRRDPATIRDLLAIHSDLCRDEKG